MINQTTVYENLKAVAVHLREKLTAKKYILLFAYNGTGKTRLTMDFKELGKVDSPRDTLYFNAFTEDLFIWDNDLEKDESRHLRLNMRSRFFEGIEAFDIQGKVRDVLIRYADFNFYIRKEKLTKEEAESELYQQSITLEDGNYYVNFVSFEREIVEDGQNKKIEEIKISRGEENIFFWCFFLAIAQLALDAMEPADPYSWVKNIYIDDPISSLDENNLIFVACDLTQLILDEKMQKKVVISTHHSLFFNVLSNQLKAGLGRAWEKKLIQYFFRFDNESEKYQLKEEKSDIPYSYHLTIIDELEKAVKNNAVKIYHFNMMRSILEKTSAFFGYKEFTECIKEAPKIEVFARFLNLFSHGKDSFFAYREPSDEHKELLEEVLNTYLDKYKFNTLNVSAALTK